MARGRNSGAQRNNRPEQSRNYCAQGNKAAGYWSMPENGAGRFRDDQFPGQGIFQGNFSRPKKIHCRIRMNTGDWRSTRELAGI